ncbi:hypothetical protein F5Y03DRAFT_395996 [Xylaria venustula]|nr:hypothetical protein F5Y03DRAFT_395996 [Xylaria venustula]
MEAKNQEEPLFGCFAPGSVSSVPRGKLLFNYHSTLGNTLSESYVRPSNTQSEMDPSFEEVMESLSAMQDKANEQHRVAMTEANVPLATLGRDHKLAMDEADARLIGLNHFEQEAAGNSERLRSHVIEYENEMAEADRRMRKLSSGSERRESQ